MIPEQKLARLKELLTEEILTELGSEQHEICPPNVADEVRGILYDKPWLVPFTPEEAEKAYNEAMPVPLSEERIGEIVAYATREDR